MTDSSTPNADLAQLEAQYDPSMAFRPIGPTLGYIVLFSLAAMAAYHYYYAAFGTLRQVIHLGIHISFVLGLTFILFSGSKIKPGQHQDRWYHIQSVPFWDYLLVIAIIVSAMFQPFIPPEEIAHRGGNPEMIDVVMGSIMLICVLEASRRAIGLALPLIAIIFLLYAFLGPYMPGLFIHGGASWKAVINQLYFTNEGFYGHPIGVMAKYVFLFILFGVLAIRVGLGGLFVDFATIIAGRYAGGPAKVSIFSSALMGTISGSSIANTVSTGALTIPTMRKVGYPPHFAAAVEATSSAGGQITPPIMGSAAFIMAEYLEIPYQDILIAALIPALMHYFGIFIMVHLEAKKLGLRGLSKDELPAMFIVLKRYWMSLIPLIVLLYFLFSGKSPDYAAMMSITTCLVVGFLTPHNRLTFKDVINCFAQGSRYALAVGTAAAAVSIIVAIVTLTGVGFRFGAAIVNLSKDVSVFLSDYILVFLTTEMLTLFFTLLFTAIACIFMGAGIPTTATYIILSAIMTPAFSFLGIEPLVAHFFVFYYGVLADITPPVALAAYAGAGIAGADPFKTGNTAFRLGIAKAIVPIFFVYSPELLLISQNFNMTDFIWALSRTMTSIGLLGIFFTGYLIAPMNWVSRIFVVCAALACLYPEPISLLVAAGLCIPAMLQQLYRRRTAA